MITTINEFKQQLIRISCASLASIQIDGKYLVLLNNSTLKRGKKVYTPFGGALEYLPKALDFLNTLNPTFEKSTPDLRFTIPLNNLEKYKEWFYNQVDREISIDRELYEELVTEEKVLQDLKTSDYTIKYIRTDESISEYNDIMNYRYFELYNIVFDSNIIGEIKENLKLDNTHLKLVSKEEILNLKTNDDIEIGDNCKNIL